MDSAELNAKSEPKTMRRIEVLTGPERGGSGRQRTRNGSSPRALAALIK